MAPTERFPAIATSSLGLLASSSISATGPLSYNVATGVFTIAQSGPSTDGYLSQGDWNSFNNRLSTSTLGLFDKSYFFSTTSATYFSASRLGVLHQLCRLLPEPESWQCLLHLVSHLLRQCINDNPLRPTTANTFTNSNTFTNAPIFSSLTSGGLAVDALGNVYKAATTTFSSGLSYSNGNVTNTGVTSIVAGSGISINTGTGAVTVTDANGYPFAAQCDDFADRVQRGDSPPQAQLQAARSRSPAPPPSHRSSMSAARLTPTARSR